MVFQEGLVSSQVIDLVGKREVAIDDIPGAFLQSPFPDDKFVLARFIGKLVNNVC